MPDWINVVILAIVEGITEFLPISSTGHLLITEKLLRYDPTEVFNVVIQSGAVIAVIPLFSKRFDQFIHRWRDPATRDYLAKLILAFVLTCIGGFIMQKRGWKLDPNNIKSVGVALLVGGILFVVVELLLRNKKMRDEVTWDIAIAVGLGQLVAAYFPGASRSGTTILLSLILGLSRPAATEFSFLVSIPTMLAAGASEIHKALHHHPGEAANENWSLIMMGTIIAAIVSFIAVKWLLRYVQTHTFIAFGWYRIAVGIAILVWAMR
jgi:undecaprenyl-diphosphatase